MKKIERAINIEIEELIKDMTEFREAADFGRYSLLASTLQKLVAIKDSVSEQQRKKYQI